MTGTTRKPATPHGTSRDGVAAVEADTSGDEKMITEILACPATPALARFGAAAIWAAAYLTYQATKPKAKSKARISNRRR